MKPINNKSLLHFVFEQMEKLSSGEISIAQAKAQAQLAKSANACFKYELDRINTVMMIEEYAARTGRKVEFRQVEGKNFD